MAGKKDKHKQADPQSQGKPKKSPSPKKANRTVRKRLSKRVVFPVVGIGASAGGLEALQELFTNTPSDTGMAFVLISHLDPSHASLLPELLKRYTAMPICEAEDNMPIKKDRIYIIPRNKDMGILDATLRLSEPSQSHGMRLPIDLFFRSLAREQGAGAIGDRLGRHHGIERHQGRIRDSHHSGPGDRQVQRHAPKCDSHQSGRFYLTRHGDTAPFTRARQTF
jgi:chemotaxis response regulator CheB